MINPKEFYDVLIKNGIDCFTGVPDSLLKNFCAYVTDNSDNHTICANEGNAIAQAAGHYLATGLPALTYMQNSGLGNCVNPLLSLSDEDVYNIPHLLLIGLRGNFESKDEPQHAKQGKVTTKLLEAIDVEYVILDENWQNQLQNAIDYCKNTKKSYALIAKKGAFDKYELKNKTQNDYELSREDAIKILLEYIPPEAFIFSTTGFTSRELYENSQNKNHNFMTVGSMGHNSSIALGCALEKANNDFYCLDGDGAMLMHTGALAVISSKNPKNFKHILLNNSCHDSVGAQPTAVGCVDFKDVAKSFGYKNCYSAENEKELREILEEFVKKQDLSFLEIKVQSGARADLGRPKETPIQNKENFMETLSQNG